MKGLPALVLTYVFNVLAVASTDYAPGIYCNNVTKTWNESVEDCKDKGGTLVSYVTDIGKTLDELCLKEDIDVWTADYAWEPKRSGFSSARIVSVMFSHNCSILLFLLRFSGIIV
ncbi:uncharacterized protein LOC128546174 [Mercenaria mercenaria]|uniref:uncharacterized protein LOC128546174 n=1 Tax=Mercenaria mercenaria TaxID=6596 RepID=UPI00234E61A0|nr:uncharacterized protein LOC128546174 [Mercenaria mercenaria]